MSWTVEGKFGKVKIAPSDVAQGEFSADSLGHVKLTLRDGTKLGGRLADHYLGFRIEPGPALKIFVGKIETFAGGKPSEQPSAATQPSR